MRIVLGFERCSKPKVRDLEQTRGLFDVQKHGHVLAPGRYVGAEEAEDDGDPFEAKMSELTALLMEQQAEGVRLDSAILSNLQGLSYGN